VYLPWAGYGLDRPGAGTQVADAADRDRPGAMRQLLQSRSGDSAPRGIDQHYNSPFRDLTRFTWHQPGHAHEQLVARIAAAAQRTQVGLRERSLLGHGGRSL